MAICNLLSAGTPNAWFKLAGLLVPGPSLKREEKLCTQHLGEKTDRLLEIGDRYTEVIPRSLHSGFLLHYLYRTLKVLSAR